MRGQSVLNLQDPVSKTKKDQVFILLFKNKDYQYQQLNRGLRKVSLYRNLLVNK
jgi:hypothetical protein